MKQFIKDWIFTPKMLGKLISIKHIFNYKYDKSLFSNQLQNLEKGNRCFIVGTGSSIKQQDLTLLKDEIVIGVSGLYNHDDFKTIHPKYYVNPPIFSSHSKYYSEDKFVSYLKEMDSNLPDSTILFLHIGDKKYIEKYNIFQGNTIMWKDYRRWDEEVINSINLSSMPGIFSVSESAIQIAIYLGFDEIYLLGFDHDWYNGLFNYAFDLKQARRHFAESAKDVILKHNIDSEFQMRRHARIFNKYKKLYALKQNIYNANANESSYVDTFPKVKYEELFYNENYD